MKLVSLIRAGKLIAESEIMRHKYQKNKSRVQ